MKNMMKKALATLAALAIMLSVTVIPVTEDNNENTVVPMYDLWNEESLTNRN